MTLNLNELKRLAEEATPGPWTHSRFGALVAGPMQKYVNGKGQEQIAMTIGASWMRKDEGLANADFIAAANPRAVLYLIEEIERLQRDVSALLSTPSRDAQAAPSVPEGWQAAVEAMSRAKKLPVWDAIDHRLHVELDVIFKELAAVPSAPSQEKKQ